MSSEPSEATAITSVNTEEVTEFVEVPAKLLGVIIGRKGEMCRRIETETRASIVVPRKGAKEQVKCGVLFSSVPPAFLSLKLSLPHTDINILTQSHTHTLVLHVPPPLPLKMTL